jgi:MoxR-like ATPase
MGLRRHGEVPDVAPVLAGQVPQFNTVIQREVVGDPAMGAGVQLLDDSMEQLGYVVKGDREALLGYTVAKLVGANFVAFGPSGTGKTQLLHYGPNLISGLGEHSVKFLPPQSDLTGKEVTGGTVVTLKRVTEDGVERLEENSMTIDPILHPDVEILIGDEINRSNPLALGAMLEALESGRVVNNEGEHELKRLQFGAFAFNPRGIDRTVYNLSSAFISRLPIGVVMGVNPDDEDAIITAAIRKKLSQPENMKPITNFEEIVRLRTIAEGLKVSQGVELRALKMIKNANHVIKESGIIEGVGRMAGQFVKVASGLAVLGGRQIEIADFAQAVRFGVVSRIGASEVKTNPEEAYIEVLNRSGITEQEREQSWLASLKQVS